MSERVFAVLGLFDSAQALLDAAKRIAPQRLGRLEAYTPYPVHGIDEVLGTRKSPLAGMTLVAGALGAITAMVFEWWTSASDYPLITGGKAPFSWPTQAPGAPSRSWYCPQPPEARVHRSKRQSLFSCAKRIRHV